MSLRSRLSHKWNADADAPIEGTVIGDIDGPTAIVSRDGTVGALDGSWRFEWGAGADDGWHIARDGSTVCQSRVDNTPVFATAMSVPGGEVVCRVGAATDGVTRRLVVEFTNESPGGVALGCVMSFGGAIGHTGDHRASIDRSDMRVGDRLLLTSMRPAGGVAAGSGEPWSVVTDGPTATSAEARIRGSDNFGAMVFPLPHRATLLSYIDPGAVWIDDRGDESGFVADERPVDRVVSPADIAAGWRAIARRGAAIDVPDRQMNQAWSRIVPDLVIAAGSDDAAMAASVAPHLDAAGLHDEADRARTTVVIAAEAGMLHGLDAVAAVAALASRDLLAGLPSGLDQLIGGLLADAGDSMDRATLAGAAMAIGPDDQVLATDLVRLAAGLPDDESIPPSADPAVGSNAGGSPVARAASVVLDHLIGVDHLLGVAGENGSAASRTLDLLPVVPVGWFGQPLDVRGLVTRAGVVSFSLRWHGARPALLWERVGGPRLVVLTCSGLDPSWESTDRQGEALLAGQESRGRS